MSSGSLPPNGFALVVESVVSIATSVVLTGRVDVVVDVDVVVEVNAAIVVSTAAGASADSTAETEQPAVNPVKAKMTAA